MHVVYFYVWRDANYNPTINANLTTPEGPYLTISLQSEHITNPFSRHHI